MNHSWQMSPHCKHCLAEQKKSCQLRGVSLLVQTPVTEQKRKRFVISHGSRERSDCRCLKPQSVPRPWWQELDLGCHPATLACRCRFPGQAPHGAACPRDASSGPVEGPVPALCQGQGTAGAPQPTAGGQAGRSGCRMLCDSSTWGSLERICGVAKAGGDFRVALLWSVF